MNTDWKYDLIDIIFNVNKPIQTHCIQYLTTKFNTHYLSVSRYGIVLVSITM